MKQKQNILSIHLLSALLTPLAVMPFTTEETIGYSNVAAKYSTKKFTFLLFISCFTVSVIPSINIPESPSNFTILIISFISSF